MEYDELELDTLGDQKTALFVILSDTDSTFNFVAALMYSQLFNLLCDKADDFYGGRLPVHVRLILDEFANIGQIPNFDKLIATIRSREISASIILQSQSQLKTIYKDAADTIVGNCDSTLFLGGKEKSTLKEISELLGKETIDLYNQSENRGSQVSHGLSYQKLGKDLPDTLGDHELNWALCEPASSYSYSREVFYEGQCQGIPMLESRHMSASTPEGEAQLERFASCGGEYADAPLLIFDVRGNPGGSDRWFMEWFKGWTGQYAEPRQAGGQRFSQLRRQNPMLSYPEEWMGTWDVYSDPGRWVEREGYTFLLTDGGTASSGETVVEHLHSVENTLVVGIPSGGCALVPNNMHFYLPNTGVELYFGTGLCLIETDENRDGVGYLPDLWVNPVEAPVAVARLCGYYGLKEPVS